MLHQPDRGEIGHQDRAVSAHAEGDTEDGRRLGLCAQLQHELAGLLQVGSTEVLRKGGLDSLRPLMQTEQARVRRAG